MTLEELINIARNFYYLHPFIALLIAVVLVLFIYHSPKETLQILGAVALFFLVVYGFSILGKTSSYGVNKEKQMVKQTVNRLESKDRQTE